MAETWIGWRQFHQNCKLPISLSTLRKLEPQLRAAGVVLGPITWGKGWGKKRALIFLADRWFLFLAAKGQKKENLMNFGISMKSERINNNPIDNTPKERI